MRSNAKTDRLRGMKIKIYPTEEQKLKIDKIFNLYRYVYNWSLATINQHYAETSKLLPFVKLCKIYSEFRNKEGNEWLKELAIGTAREAMLNVYAAFDNFFKRGFGFPKFKSKKGETKKSFTSRGERMYVFGTKVKLEGFDRGDTIETHTDRLPIPKYVGHHVYIKPTVSFDGDSYWLSISYERDMIEYDISNKEPIGIDVGVRELMTVSDGSVYHLPDTTKLYKRLKRQQRALKRDYDKRSAEAKRISKSEGIKTTSQDLPKSKNMLKREAALRKTYRRIHNINNTYMHTAVKEILDKAPSTVVIEDITVKSMLKSLPFLKKKVPQMMFHTLHEMIQYKAADRGIPVIKANKTYPSSKICSCCGAKNDVGKSKVYTCSHCGLTIDRDLNAAYNLRNLAYTL